MNSERGMTNIKGTGTFRRFYIFLSIIILVITTLVTCEKPERSVLVTILDAIEADISYTSVTLKGEIEDLGSAPIDDYGILASENSTPGPDNSKVKSLGKPSAKGSFEAKVENLTSNTKYYFRAYVTVKGANVYSEQTKQFTTKAYSLPTVTTTDVTSVTSSSGVSGGNVTADGGASITARGVCWSASANPTTADTKTTDGSGTGTFTSNIAGLTSLTTYHVRAYATNSAGTAYGSDVTFTTGVIVVIPTVSTLEVTSIGTTSATGGGSVSDAGHGTVTARGVCWAQYANPVTADFKTVDGEGTGSFLSSMTNLTPSTTYHVRAYATNSAGTGYGSDVTFTTNAAVAIPTVTTASVTSIGSTTATCGGSITSDGGGTITGKGVCWSTSANPTIGDQKTIDGTGTASFASNISGLTASTIYHVRAYATNSAGTGYGSDITFTTSATSSVPTVTTTAISAITSTGASSGGNVTSDGGASVTARGVCWSTGSNPVATDNHTTDGTGTGIFTSSIAGLTADTKYYIRAYATNSAGTAYGEALIFRTLCTQPTLATNAASNISYTTATLNGTVNANNFSTIPLFQWGTTTSYGTTINATPSPVDGTSNTAVSVDITNLSPGTLYHFRVTGTSCGVDSYGNDQTFTTNSSGTPIVTTTAVTGITSTSATSGGNVTSDGGATVTAKGVCWSTSTSPVATGNHTTNGTGTGIFTSSITGLTGYKDYYVRAYATNSAGTSYGEELQFTTLCTPPTLTANAASNISYTTATLNGTVNANGFPTTSFFQYGTTTSYGTTVNATPHSVDGASNIAVSVDITSLSPGTLYHFRVTGTSCGVDSYGNDQTFTTSALGVPAITTTLVNSITGSTASSGGTITSDGGAAVTISGICWSTAHNNPTVFDSKTTDGTTTGTFTSALTSLNPNKLYYVRAYATNSNGIGYGNEVSFTTLQLPAVTTDAASSMTSTSSTLNGTVNANGTDTDVTFEYGTSTSYGSTANASPALVTGTSNTSISAAIIGLSENTTYHFRVKAVSIAGTTYGNDQTFITLCVAPAATVNAATNLGGTTATLNGIVNANSFSTTVTFEYGPTTSFGSTIDATPNIVTGSGSTTVSAAVTGLLTNTVYYYRIKAVNCAGTIYSSETNLTTLQPPSATTSAATSVAYTTAALNGLVNANNSASTVTFEYGLNTSYGTTVSATPGTVTGNIATTVSAAISGLTTSTTYHYRVKAVSSGGSKDGDDMTFITAVPPTVTSITASPIATTTATLNCSVNPNGQSADVYFEYGLSTSYGSTANGTPLTVTGSSATAVSASVSGLSAGTTYHYRVKTVSLVVTFYTSDNTFITLCNTPSATTNAASAITNTTATFNGVANANGFSTTVTFDWGTDITYGNSKAASPGTVTGSSNTSVTGAMTGLSPNTTYHYRVQTVNCGGTVYGGDQSFETLCTASTATTDAPTFVNTTFATLNGTVNASNSSTTVTFEYGLTTSYGSTGNASPYTVTGTTNTAVSRVLTSLTSNTTYHYRVIASSCGGVVYGSDQAFTTPCPASISVSHVVDGVSPVAKTVTYGIVQSSLYGGSKCWITQNLGADNEATSATDATEPSAGWYWRFNTTQGYKHDGTNRTPSGGWPGAIDENSNWISANDPCTILLGSGWRIPTNVEWFYTDSYGGWTNYTGAYITNGFKFHTAGQIIGGNLDGRGIAGCYSSSTQATTTTAYYYVITSSSSTTSSISKGTYGFSLRCLRD